MYENKYIDIPLVSVVITCYNYAKYVSQAIESVLSQTYPKIELIVINDGSTDESASAIANYKNKAKIINQKNRGIVATRNIGLKLSKGEYVCFLDADDFFDVNYIEEMLKIALKHHADIVYPNWRVFGKENYVTNFKEFDLVHLIKQEIHCTSESLILKKSIGNSKFQNEIIAEDWDFFIGMALRGCNFKLAPNCFVNYRIHGKSRGRSRPYWDDMYNYCEILVKWSRKYPKKINPFDLPIYAGVERDKIIENLRTAINNKDKDISELQEVIKKQKDSIDNIKSSVLYRVGINIIKSIRCVKSSIFRSKK